MTCRTGTSRFRHLALVVVLAFLWTTAYAQNLAPPPKPIIDSASVVEDAKAIIVQLSESDGVGVQIVVNGAESAPVTKFGGKVRLELAAALETGDVVRVRQRIAGVWSPFAEASATALVRTKPRAPAVVKESLAAGSNHLFVQVDPALTGGKVTVFQNGTEVGSRMFASGGTVSVRLETSPLLSGAFVRAVVERGGSASDHSAEVQVPQGADWGRVRAQFWGGIILGQKDEEAGGFSQQDPYVGVTVLSAFSCPWSRPWDTHEDEWQCGGSPDRRLRRFGFNTEVDVRLTSALVATSNEQRAPAPLMPQASDTPDEPATAFSSARFRATALAPIRLTHFDQGEIVRYFALAPLVFVGRETITEQRRTGNDDFYNQFGVGARLAFHELRKGTNSAAEPVNYVTVAWGRYENFKPKESVLVVEGRLVLPGLSPLLLGVDLVSSKGRDDARFIFGATFDIGSAARKLIG